MTSYLIGIDEVGRGCLAGDVYAAGVCAPVGTAPVAGVKDSKVLRPRERTELEVKLRACKDIRWVVASCSVQEINAIGIVRAVTKCFLSCAEQLLDQPGVTEIVVDGTPVWETLRFRVPTRFAPKADATVWAVSAASIIAKVQRDQYMIRLAEQHPGYGWDNNMGYGTPTHIAALREKGMTPHHRTQFCQSALRNKTKIREPDPLFDLPDLDRLFS